MQVLYVQQVLLFFVDSKVRPCFDIHMVLFKTYLWIYRKLAGALSSRILFARYQKPVELIFNKKRLQFVSIIKADTTPGRYHDASTGTYPDIACIWGGKLIFHREMYGWQYQEPIFRTERIACSHHNTLGEREYRTE